MPKPIVPEVEHEDAVRNQRNTEVYEAQRGRRRERRSEERETKHIDGEEEKDERNLSLGKDNRPQSQDMNTRRRGWTPI